MELQFNVKLQPTQVMAITKQVLLDSIIGIENTEEIAASDIEEHEVLSHVLGLFSTKEELSELETREIPSAFINKVVELSA